MEPSVERNHQTQRVGRAAYRIQWLSHPTNSIRINGLYQTAGIIEKDAPDGAKEHRFVRADTHQNMDDAINFTISKAKQIIDMQGDRMFV